MTGRKTRIEYATLVGVPAARSEGLGVTVAGSVTRPLAGAAVLLALVLVVVATALGGTPFYAYDLDVIERRLAALRDVLPASVEVAYATKANPSLAVVAHLASLGAAGDIASGGELELVQRAGMEEAWEQLESLPEPERERRWQVIRRMHDQFGERVLAHLRQHDR